MAIRSFGDTGTEDIFHGRNSKAARRVLPEALHPVAGRKLDILDEAESLESLRMPGLRLHRLKGARAGVWSVSINMQYRIVFRWKGDAGGVTIEDYHR